MTKIVDPIQIAGQLVAERRAESRIRRKIDSMLTSAEVAGAREDVVPYEMPLVPPAGAKLLQLTCGSTYRDPIPVQFDPATRTCYPIVKG